MRLPPAVRRTFLRLAVPVALFAGRCPLRGATADAAPTLRNDFLVLRVSPSDGRFSVQQAGTAAAWSASGRIVAGGGDAQVLTIEDPAFGTGQAVRLNRTDGTSAECRVFPHLPFVLVRSTSKNTTGAVQVLNHVPLLDLSVELGAPASALTTLGTGGLLAADKNPGSFVWLAVADPKTRRGVVAAWLTENRASGLVFSGLEGQRTALHARADYGRLRLEPGASAESEVFAVGGFEDARLGLEAWADAVARQYRIRLRPIPAGYCTWYSDRHNGAGDERSLADLARFAADKLRPYGLNFIQIDDGWQDGDAKGDKAKRNGPNKNFTRIRPAGPYPSGMKQTAGMISSFGFTPGIWFMPFAGTFDDPWFRDKQDWFVRRENGTPFDLDWGGTSLDMSHPQAREYVRTIAARAAQEWGYRYFKMDGLYTGIAADPRYVETGYREDDFGNAVFHRPERTNTEIYRSGLELVREAAGPDVFFLGCSTTQNMRTFGASFGLVDAMRIGPDNSANYKAWMRSPTFGTRYYFLNGRVWYNDPDPMYVRTRIADEDARTMATWTGISGQLFTNSDWLPDLPPARLDLIRRTLPQHGCTARPIDLFEHDPARLWQVTDSRGTTRRDVVAVFNWGDESATVPVAWKSLSLPPARRYAAFDFWANRFVPPVSGDLAIKLPAHGCRVLALRPLADQPVLISTSRHVTQGMIDVSEEAWDAAQRMLVGRSDVIAGDGYELRIATPGPAWRAARVTLDAAAVAAGATARLMNEEGGVRVRIDVSQSRPVSWRVAFE